MFKFSYEGIRTKSADIILVFSFSALNILSSNIYKIVIVTISNMHGGAFSQKQFRDFSRNFLLLENSNKYVSQGSKYAFALTYFDSPSLSSSQRRCSIEIGVLRKFHKIIWEISVLEFLFDKVAGLQSCNFIRKRLQDREVPLKFKKFLRTPILKNICKRLLSII